MLRGIEVKILFLAYNPTSLNCIKSVIEDLKMLIDCEPVLVCQNCYYSSNEYRVINFEKPDFNQKSLGGQTQNTSDWYNKNCASWYYQIKLFFQILKSMRKADKKAIKILNMEKPDVLIVTDDRVGGIHMAILKYAEDYPVIRIPAAVQLDYNKSFYSRKFDKALVYKDSISNVNWIQHHIDPRLVHTINGDSRVFCQTGEMVAYKCLNMLPCNPWVVGASKCDYIMVASSVEKKRVLDAIGDSHDEVVVTGLYEDYDIVKSKAESVNRRDEISEKYAIDNRNDMVVFSVPHAAEHNMVSWEIHNYNIKGLSEELYKRYGKVLFSLHPKSRHEDYAYLEELGYGCICDEKLSYLIAAVDTLVTWDCSSVVYWPMLLNKKSIIIKTDLMKSRIEDFENAFSELSVCKDDIMYRTGDDIKSIPLEIVRAINVLVSKKDNR